MRLTLIDVSSLAFPIWHMAGSDPNPNAVSDQLVARVRALGDEHTALCCDAGRSFRHDISADYKANRKPEERAVLYHQIDLALDRLRGDGFPIWFVKGFEADDVIASAALQAATRGHDVLIVSADKDLLQLIADPDEANPGVTAKSLKTGDIIDAAAVEARFGVLPAQMRDYLSIVGDASDNVKGVVGIGEKGAAALLQAYGSLDAIYEQLATETGPHAGLKPSQVLALRAFEPRLHEVRTLITLRTDAPVPFDEILEPRIPLDVPEMTDDTATPAESAETGPDDIDEAMPTIAAAGPDQPVLPPPPPPPPPPPAKPPVVNGTVTVMDGPPPDWKVALEPTTMSEAITLAKHAFDSKQFSAYGTPQAVLMSLLAGRELGLSAMASLRAIHLIDGKPTMAADLMRALVIKSGAVKYFRCVERTAEQSTWEAQRGEDPPIRLTFTMDEARQAGVVKPNSGWTKFPTDMLVARASAKLARLVAPDVMHGLYLPEEIRENL
jgi:DNA polymerase-1